MKQSSYSFRNGAGTGLGDPHFVAAQHTSRRNVLGVAALAVGTLISGTSRDVAGRALSGLVGSSRSVSAAQSGSMAGISTTTLIDQEIGWVELPKPIEQVVIATWEFEPGEEPVALPGTSLLSIETGELTAYHTSTIRAYIDSATPGPMHTDTIEEERATYEPGEQLAALSTYGTGVTIVNEGDALVTGLIVSLLRSDIDLPESPGLTFTTIARLDEGPGMQDYEISLVRHTYDVNAEFEVIVPDAAYSIIIIERGMLNIQPSGQTLHNATLEHPAQPAGQFERVPGEHFNLLTADWLLSGPGTVATRNIERGESSSVLVLTLASAEDTNATTDDVVDDLELPLGVLLDTNVAIPSGPIELRATRETFEPGDRLDLPTVSGAVSLLVESGEFRVLVALEASIQRANGLSDSDDEQIAVGQPGILGVGDGFTVNGPHGFFIENTGDMPASLLVLRFLVETPAETVESSPSGLEPESQSLMQGMLPVGFGESTGLILSRFNLAPGSARGPFSIDNGQVIMAIETGRDLFMELTEGEVTSWHQDRSTQAPTASGPIQLLNQGDALVFALGAAGTLTNTGSETSVILSLGLS